MWVLLMGAAREPACGCCCRVLLVGAGHASRCGASHARVGQAAQHWQGSSLPGSHVLGKLAALMVAHGPRLPPDPPASQPP